MKLRAGRVVYFPNRACLHWRVPLAKLQHHSRLVSPTAFSLITLKTSLSLSLSFWVNVANGAFCLQKVMSRWESSYLVSASLRFLPASVCCLPRQRLRPTPRSLLLWFLSLAVPARSDPSSLPKLSALYPWYHAEILPIHNRLFHLKVYFSS